MPKPPVHHLRISSVGWAHRLHLHVDVIHPRAVPSFGFKIGSVPDRLNQMWFKADREGASYGQRSELCGIDHLPLGRGGSTATRLSITSPCTCNRMPNCNELEWEMAGPRRLRHDKPAVCLIIDERGDRLNAAAAI
ncbi:hypothetical protein JO965_40800 (plasmid) [Microvirga sp. VF16]|nr:hypothetical protein JO965_40800 [Microvirga sp. VF16]